MVKLLFKKQSKELPKIKNGYFKKLASKISLCGDEEILLMGYGAEKLLKTLLKRSLKGNITVLADNDGNIFKDTLKKYKDNKQVKVLGEIQEIIQDKHLKFGIIVSHYYTKDQFKDDYLSLLSSILEHDGVLYLRGNFGNEPIKKTEKTLQQHKFFVLKKTVVSKDEKYQVYDFKLRHDS